MESVGFRTLCRLTCRVAAVVAMLIAPLAAGAQQADSLCTPRTLPWSESFEGEGYQIPPCWTAMEEYFGYPYIYHGGYYHTGSASMAMLGGSGTDVCMLATPRMAHRADSLHVGFYLTANDGSGVLQVGLVSDTSNAATFVAMLTLDLTTAQLGYYEFYTDGHTRMGNESVAFRLTDGRVAFDDVEVEAATPCRRPWMPVVGLVTHTSISLSWSDPGTGAFGYVVRRIDTASLDTAYLTAYATSVLIAGLAPATAYRLDVATLCGSDTTGWMPAGVVTTDVACHQPLSLALEASTATAAVLGWQHDTTGFLQPTALRLALRDMTASAPFGDMLTLTGNHAFLSGLATGHHYRATVQALCTADTSAPVTLVFTPLAAPCSEREGTSYSSASVVNGGVRHNYSQMLYPKEVAGGADTLYGLAFRVVDNQMFVPRILTVYVGQTTDSVLTTNIVSPFMTRVADGFSLPSDAEGWVDIPFDSPLAIDTARNLVVAVLDNTGNPTGVLTFGVHYEPLGGTLYTSSATLPIDPAVFDLPMYSISHVADLRLYGNCAMDACQPPAAAITSQTDTSLTIQWAGGGSSTVVVCGAEGEASPALVAVTGTACTVAPLAASTRYTLRVGTVCGADTAFGPEIHTTTACGTVAVPYTVDFAAGAHPCWQGALREVEEVGVVPVSVLLSPEVTAAASGLQVRLAVRTLVPDATLRVGVASADGSLVTWVDSVAAQDIYEGEWVAYLDGYAGSDHHIAVDADNSFVIQSVGIEPLDACLPPRGMTVGNVGYAGATLTWQAAASSFEVFLREADGDAWSSWTTSAAQLTLTGLMPQTSYVGYAVSHCTAAGEPSARSWFRFTTECGQIRYFPYTMGFEAQERTFECWNVAYADPACATANPVTITENRSCSGRRSLRFSSYNNINSNNYDQFLISPRIVSTDSIFLAFRCYKDNYDSEPFQVGFSTSGNSPIDFLWMGEVESQAGQWMSYEQGFPAATRYVAIRYMGRGNYHLYVDDIAILGPGCAAPQLTMVDEQADAVTVRWQADADTALVAITDGLWLSDATGTEVVGDTYTFSGLQSGRSYTIGIRTRCADGRLSDWTTRRVTTIDTACTAPVELTVDSVGYTIVRLSWTPASEGQPCQIALFADGELRWQSGRLMVPSCIVTGLEANRDYSVVVRAYCTEIPGPWSDTLRFSTIECQTVSGVEYERNDYRTVTLTWTPAPVTTGRCRIEYGPEGFSRGSGTVIESAAPCRVAGLDPYGNYDFYIQNYCEPGVVSDSTAYIFIPSGVGIAEVDDLKVEIYPNPSHGDVTVGVSGPSVVTVIDLRGREVVPPTQVSSSLLIPRSALPAGAYFVRVVTDSGATVGKLIMR